MTDATHLDFTNYPHVVRPSELEDKQELEKRSAAITDIKNISENLFKAIESYVFDLVSYDQKIKTLNQRDFESTQRENDLNKKEKELIEREETVQREKGYISKLNLELTEKEKALAADRIQMGDLQSEIDKFEQQRSELIKQQALAETKLKAVKEIEEKEQDLERRELLVEKAAEVDKERKRLLDIREERIVAREKYLAISQSE